MRWKGPIISFLLTLTVGVVVSNREEMTDWLWPSFEKCEVKHLVGRRVGYRHTPKFIGMKTADDGTAKPVVDGEQGTIVGLEPVHDGGFFLIVRWDEPHGSGNYLSYFGRYTRREALAE